jgi:hypothetical protein
MPVTVKYGRWCLKFAVSVSWRVLKYWSEDPRYASLLLEKRLLAERALQQWRKFLLDETPNPAEFEQHILPVGMVKKPVPGMSPWFNRYAARAVDHTFAFSSEIMFVFSKLGHLSIFGMIPPEPRVPGWTGTKLHVRSGHVALGGDAWIEIPGAIVEFMSSRADHAAAVMGSLSAPQQEKALKALRNANVDGELFEAFLRDFQLFGDAALGQREDE